MVKNTQRKDFGISTRGLDILQTIMYINIALIIILVIFGCFSILKVTGNILSPISVILVGMIISLPSVIICCLINMFIDYMYNVEQQSKMQYNLDITSRKILEEIQIFNSYRSEQNN